MVSPFQKAVRTAVLEQLESRPHTIGELASNLNYSYDSTRNAVHALRDEGLVNDVYNGNARNIKFSLSASNNGPNKLVPNIVHSNGRSKLSDLVRHRFTSNSPGNQAVYNLPRDVTRLMHLALKAKRGSDVTKQVAMVRKSMEASLETLQGLVSIYEQILANDRNFDVNYLVKYPNDEQFDTDSVMEAYSYYFKEE